MLGNRMPGSELIRLGKQARAEFNLPATEAVMWEVRGRDTESHEEDPDGAGANLRRKCMSAEATDDTTDSDDEQQCKHTMQANAKIGIGAASAARCRVPDSTAWSAPGMPTAR